MDARQALDDLMEVSAQVTAAAVLRADGSVEAATIGEAERAEAFAAAARSLLEAADSAAEGRALAQLEVATAAGCVFVVREGERAVAAATGQRPTAGLVVYDLKTCLRNLAAGESEKPKRRRAPRKTPEKESA